MLYKFAKLVMETIERTKKLARKQMKKISRASIYRQNFTYKIIPTTFSLKNFKWPTITRETLKSIIEQLGIKITETNITNSITII